MNHLTDNEAALFHAILSSMAAAQVRMDRPIAVADLQVPAVFGTDGRALGEALVGLDAKGTISLVFAPGTGHCSLYVVCGIAVAPASTQR